MEQRRNQNKKSPLLLAWLIVFQSCVVYHKTPATLEQAANERIKTKITTSNGEVVKFDHVAYEEGMFYGMEKKSGRIQKTPLRQDNVSAVQLKNKKASGWANVAIVTGSIIIMVMVAGWHVENNGFGIELDN